MSAEWSMIHPILFLPPANDVCEGYVFTPVSHSVHRGGGVRAGGIRGKGGHAWWRGGTCGKGACVAKGGGHVWQERQPLKRAVRYASYWNAFLFGERVAVETYCVQNKIYAWSNSHSLKIYLEYQIKCIKSYEIWVINLLNQWFIALGHQIKNPLNFTMRMSKISTIYWFK